MFSYFEDYHLLTVLVATWSVYAVGIIRLARFNLSKVVWIFGKSLAIVSWPWFCVFSVDRCSH